MTKTAKTYGDSLYELAKEENLTGEILAQMEQAGELLGQNPEFITLLQLPSVPKKERVSLVHQAFSGQIHPYLLNFMKILTENGTVGQFAGCLEQFRNRYNQDNGILAALVVTAKPLGEDLTAKLQDKIAAVTGKTIHLTQRVDPKALGGIRLELDGQMMDGTVQSRIAALKTQLKNTVL